MNQTIYIIGVGAIGKALAVFLKLNNRNVTLIHGSVEGKSPEKENIRVELSDKTICETSIEVTTLSNFSKLDGIVILTNKSFGNEYLSQALQGKIDNTPLVVMQNGLAIEQPFINNAFPNIYRCVLFATSQLISQSALRFKPVSDSPIGTIKGNGADLNNIIQQLDNPNFHFKAVTDIQTIIWKKTIASCVFNSVCTLLDIDNGIFHRNEVALAIATRVIQECIVIAKETGISLSAHEVLESLVLISKSADGQLISTLQDIKNKRKTEIETMNFSIVNIARTLHKENLVPNTKLLGELTKLKSELNR